MDAPYTEQAKPEFQRIRWADVLFVRDTVFRTVFE